MGPHRPDLGDGLVDHARTVDRAGKRGSGDGRVLGRGSPDGRDRSQSDLISVKSDLSQVRSGRPRAEDTPLPAPDTSSGPRPGP
ncbi:hypothetical protein BN903_139 [Halorubrum sp. AJ67]|nr:hypothetical protein BN903_139 [Halorubrum sp. AJ67]